eukprot:2013253-Amphidinium_carterae.2
MFLARQQEESGQQEEVPKMVVLAPQGMGPWFWEPVGGTQNPRGCRIGGLTIFGASQWAKKKRIDFPYLRDLAVSARQATYPRAAACKRLADGATHETKQVKKQEKEAKNIAELETAVSKQAKVHERDGADSDL